MPFSAAEPLEALTAADLADLDADTLVYIVLDPTGAALSRSVTLGVLDAWLEITVGAGIVQTVVAGTGVTVDDTDPANPVVSADSAGGAIVNTDGDPGTTLYVGVTDPDVAFTPAEGDVWIVRAT